MDNPDGTYDISGADISEDWLARLGGDMLTMLLRDHTTGGNILWLTHDYGSGFSKRYLAFFRKFYLTVPDGTILQTRLQNVSWSHILTTLRVDDATARRWYLETASEQSS